MNVESDSARATDVMIEVNSITKSFGSFGALNNVSFKVHRGEIFSLIGPSGCGKTTLLRSIAGLEDIDSGEIYIAGKLVSSREKRISITPERREIGLVFQSYALWPHMTAYDNVAAGLRARGMKNIDEKVRSSLELVGLLSKSNRYPSQLSGGEQQRVALARSLAYKPNVILLDEPLSNLDAKERERVRIELRALLKSIQITALYVTHDQEEAFAISERVAIMSKGVKVQEGSPKEIYDHPANAFVANFIGRANIYDFQIKESNGTTALINLPKLGSDLVCATEAVSNPSGKFSALIRPNEIGISSVAPEDAENVLEGTIVDQEYKGSTIDHVVQVRESKVLVTTHRFCPLAAVSGKKVYVHVPPEAITIISN